MSITHIFTGTLSAAQSGKKFQLFLNHLKPGYTFTGSDHCFQGRIEVLSHNAATNTLSVHLVSQTGTRHWNKWYENWNLKHVYHGFERGDYVEANFPDNWPQLITKNQNQ